jgi:tetratricopeptide (TPR) repeat protein
MRRNLMITYANLGGNLGSPMYYNQGDSAGAREYYGKALAIARDLAKAGGVDQLSQYDLANALLFYASLDLPPAERSGSLGLLMEAETILQKLLAADPDSINKRRALMLAQRYMGIRLHEAKRFEEALVSYGQSLALAEKGLALNPSEISFNSQALNIEKAISMTLADKGDQAGALAMARQVVARAEKISLPASEADRVKSFTASAYYNLAAVEAKFGNQGEARAAAERALAGWRRMTPGSKTFDPAEVARAEAMIQESAARLQ